MADDVGATKAAIVAEIGDMLRKIPASYPGWSYDQTHAFKAACATASKAAKNGRSTLKKLNDAVRALRMFYQPGVK